MLDGYRESFETLLPWAAVFLLPHSHPTLSGQRAFHVLDRREQAS